MPARPCLLSLAAIVGTVEPTRDFDASFRPATNRVEGRWRRVAEAHRSGQSLPPIHAIEQPEGHYILDGRHRVSVARALGLTHIDAWLVPLTARASRSPTSRFDANTGAVWF